MDRSDFIKALGLGAVGLSSIPVESFARELSKLPQTTKMPIVFIGHGSPMNALADNEFTRSLNKLGRDLPHPNAVMVISAHWLTRGTYVSSTPKPETIYDFGGFPEELSKIKYDAPGSPGYAAIVADMVEKVDVKLDTKRGLDHGTWSVLRHVYKNADLPMFQMSIDATKPPQFHYDLAKHLNPLRERGLLIIGSGNIVHNLRRVDWSGRNAEVMDWAEEFDELVKSKINSFDHQALVNYDKLGSGAPLAIPTNEHYLPMLSVLAMRGKDEPLDYFYEDIEYGSISMRCFRIG